MTTAIGLYREMDVGFGAALRALAGRPSLGTGSDAPSRKCASRVCSPADAELVRGMATP